MDTAKVIDKLNDILKWEWTGVRQYSQQAFLIAGPWREVYSGMFYDNAEECFKHAKLIGDKIVALGGLPTVERESVKQTEDLMEMLQQGLDFEQGAVQLYKEAIELADDDIPLRALLEDVIIEEQEGVDSFTKLLRQQGSGANVETANKVG